ncbi:hypothetical protein HK098_004543, partial [Nowakowskiella sp. JEL0407]
MSRTNNTVFGDSTETLHETEPPKNETLHSGSSKIPVPVSSQKTKPTHSSSSSSRSLSPSPPTSPAPQPTQIPKPVTSTSTSTTPQIRAVDKTAVEEFEKRKKSEQMKQRQDQIEHVRQQEAIVFEKARLLKEKLEVEEREKERLAEQREREKEAERIRKLEEQKERME